MVGWKRPGLELEQLQQYLERIGASDEVSAKAQQKQADLNLLKEIVPLQVRSVPFENLNQMYEPAKKQSEGKITLDVPSLVKKIVTNRRGGYCFEANELLAQALTSMGFQLYTAAGRIVLQQHPTFPGEIVLTRIEHELVLVQLEGERWVCDVGLGSATPTEPVLLTKDLLDGKETTGKGGTHRVRRGLLGVKDNPKDVEPSLPQREGWYMQKFSANRNEWRDVYFFTEQEWRSEDYEVPNMWCSNNHQLFSNTLVVALQTPEGRKTIEDKKLRIYDKDGATEKILDSQEALKAALDTHFGLRLNENTINVNV